MLTICILKRVGVQTNSTATSTVCVIRSCQVWQWLKTWLIKCSGSLVYFRPMNQNKTADRGLVQYGYILYIYLYILFPFTQWSLVVTVQLVSLRWGLCFFHPGTVSAVRNGTFSTWPTSACDSCTNCWSKPRHGGHWYPPHESSGYPKVITAAS